MSNTLYEGKTVAVTGAGSGIGQAMALTFAESGAQVAVIDISSEQAEATVALISAAGGVAKAYVCDASQQSQTIETVAAIIAQHTGRVDVWINNAGIAHVGNIEGTQESDMDRIYAVNVKGVYNGMFSVIPTMIEAGGGVILNMASIASKVGISDRFAYSMSKGAVLTMTLSVAKDYVDKHIRCNCICPGRVHTPFVDGFVKQNYPGEEKEVFEKLAAFQPMGRMGEPKEIAQLALFLCSDNASFITASAYDIDGGVTLLR